MAYIFATQQDALDEIIAANLQGASPKRDHDDDTWFIVDVDGNRIDDPADKNADDDAEEEAPREAQPGDVILTIARPFLPDAGMLEAIRICKKLGLTIEVRDAMDPTIVKDVVNKSAKAARGGGRGSSGPTETQQVIIDLCTRPQGATGAELLAAGAHGNINPSASGKAGQAGKVAWKQLAKACEKHGYVFSIQPRNKAMKGGDIGFENAYTLRPVDDAQQASPANDDAGQMSNAAD